MSHRTMEAHVVLEQSPLESFAIGFPVSSTSETYQSTLAEWQSILAPHAAFALRMEEMDSDCASYGELAQAMREAPTMVTRQVMREAVICRRERDKLLGVAFNGANADLTVFAAADQEWSDILDGQPLFKRWMGLHDRMMCSRDTVVEAMRRAPSLVVRQSMRELFLFRTVTALYTPISFQ